MKPKVFVVQPAPPGPLEELARHAEITMFPHHDRRATHAELKAGMADADYVFSLGGNPLNADMLETASRLKMIAVMEVFPKAIDLEACSAHGIPVTGLQHPDELTETTAEFTFALIMATSWRIPEADTMLRAGEWKQYQSLTLPAQRLRGKTLGIVGLGKVGRSVARMANAAQMNVIYNDRTRLDAALEMELQTGWRPLEELFAESDIVALCTILTKETKHMVGADLLSRMKKQALLINTSRGPVVDESALADALAAGTIRGAGLDVYEHEVGTPRPGPDPRLKEFDNVVLTPHMGSSAEETRRWMAQQVVDSIVGHITGGDIGHVLNPEVMGGEKPVVERIG